MSSPLHKTKGIVLRAVKFGETSLVVTVYTEMFGLQSYIVNGVRLHTKKGAGRANLFQPSSFLDLVVYHHESAHLNRLREFQWAHIYQHILTDVKRNAVALFMVELLIRSIKQPEPHPDLFHFLEDSFLALDGSEERVAANFPLFFALHLASFLGLRIADDLTETRKILDLQEGSFVSSIPSHPHFLEGKEAFITSKLLKVHQPIELKEISLNQDIRRNLLYAYEKFYALHINDFGTLKTLQVLREIF